MGKHGVAFVELTAGQAALRFCNADLELPDLQQEYLVAQYTRGGIPASPLVPATPHTRTRAVDRGLPAVSRPAR
jgi:hypothetical protein